MVDGGPMTPRSDDAPGRRGDEPRRERAHLDAATLREIGLFGGLDEATLAALAQALPVEDVDVGVSVVTEGESAREMFVVLEGELEVLKRAPNGSDVRVALLGPTSWFGEMSILDVQARSASVRALARSRLARMSAEHVERLLYRRDPKAYALFVMNIARELSRRLRVTDSILAQLVGSVAEVYSPTRKR